MIDCDSYLPPVDRTNLVSHIHATNLIIVPYIKNFSVFKKLIFPFHFPTWSNGS